MFKSEALHRLPFEIIMRISFFAVAYLFYAYPSLAFGDLDEPTVEPSALQSMGDTNAPQSEPTSKPTPVSHPTAKPTRHPTHKPTREPTIMPTAEPSAPTSWPTSNNLPRYFQCAAITCEWSNVPTDCVYGSGNVYLQVK